MGGIAILSLQYLDGEPASFVLGDDDGMYQGWSTQMHGGVPQLVLGHGLPRTHIPLHLVRLWVLEEHPDARAARENAENEYLQRAFFGDQGEPTPPAGPENDQCGYPPPAVPPYAVPGKEPQIRCGLPAGHLERHRWGTLEWQTGSDGPAPWPPQ